MNIKSLVTVLCLAASFPGMVYDAQAQRDIQPVEVGFFNTPDFTTAQVVTDSIQEGINCYLYVKVLWRDLNWKRSWHVVVLVDGFTLHEFAYDNIDGGTIHPSASQRTLWKTPLTIDRGTHTLTLIVDNRNELREAHEDNNSMTRSFTVAPYPKQVYFDDPVDFNGDGLSDLDVYDPLTSTWYSTPSTTGVAITQFGFEPTVQFVGDFDGDGRTDKGVFDRYTGNWYVQPTTDPFFTVQFGFASCQPAPADYDGDGKSDLAVYDTLSGNYYIHQSSGVVSQALVGTAGCIPVPRDYDNDGRSDPAAYDPRTGLWYIHPTSWPDLVGGITFGDDTIPVPADYNGDGFCDIGVFNTKSSRWIIAMVRVGPDLGFGGPDISEEFGYPGVVPRPGDYDGDGVADFAVYDPAGGVWFIKGAGNTVTTKQFGWSGALPVGIRP